MHSFHARRRWLRLILMLSLMPALTTQAASRPLLVELFTSQGCSSCPPADAALSALAEDPQVLALAWHVDYWDGLGWKDPFSSALATSRQHRYARTQGFDVYTPQLVVEGRRAVIGSDRAATAEALRAARTSLQAVPASLQREGAAVRIEVGATSAAVGTAHLELVSYEPSATTAIAAGENAGRRIAYSHIVRSLRRLGDWHGEPLQRLEPLSAEEGAPGLALIVQDDAGRVWATAALERR